MENIMTKEGERMVAARKARLLIDGANYRTGLIQSKAALAQGLRADSLIQAATEYAGRFAIGRLAVSLVPAGLGFKTLMPLAVVAFSYLSRQRLRKLVLGAGLIAAASALLFRRRSRPPVR